MSVDAAKRGRMALLLLIGSLGLCGFGQESGSETDRVLQKMEQAGKTFSSLSAQIAQKKWTAILQEFDTEEKGTFAYARSKEGQALIRKEIVTPAQTIAIVNRDQAVIYQPKIKQAQRIRLGQYKDKVEFMAIGVGQSAGKLKDNFDVRVLGHETLDGDKVIALELKPRSAKTAAFLAIITLWMDEQKWVPVQTKLQEPNGDYLLTRFTQLKLNSKLPDSLFSLQLPSDVQVSGN